MNKLYELLIFKGDLVLYTQSRIEIIINLSRIS